MWLFLFLQILDNNLFAYPLTSSRQAAALATSVPGLSVSRSRDGKTVSLKGKLRLKDLAGSKDVDHAFEGLDLFLNFSLKGDLSGANPSFNWWLKAAWPRGQVLFFPWFLDLSDIKGSLRARGTFHNRQVFIKSFRLYGPFSLEAKRLNLPLKEKRKGELLNRLLGAHWQLKADLKQTYNIFIRDAFSDSHPIVKKLKPQGTLLLHGKTTAIGIRLNCNLFFNTKKLIEGLVANLSYPLSKTGCDKGTVHWQEIYLASLIPREIFKEQATIAILGKNLPVTLCKNKVHVGPLKLGLGTGIISLDEARFLFSRGTLILKNLRLENLKLHDLLKDVPFEITVRGVLPQARFENQRLVFEGEIEIEAAKGKIHIANIWIEPYAPILRWGADISFQHIDLKSLTQNTSFGLVTGRVNGWVKGLIMSGLQPEAFDMRIETDKSSNEPKKISIKAIENLSILGGGGGSVSFLGRLFKKFSYSRIGISCRLKNDVFELHGLYKSGNKEYLVKRGFFGGVNVINMNPKGKISFRDMLDRLKRIGKSSQSKVEVR